MSKLLNNLLGMYKQAQTKKKAMIIDEILDRKDGASYNPQDFYDYVSHQLDVLNSEDIARALDSGTEEDVKKALCEYVKMGGYNPIICDYINSVNWLEEEDKEKWFSIKLNSEQAKEFSKLLTENNIKNKSKKEGGETRVSFFLLPSSIGVAQGLLSNTLSRFPDKQASTIKKAEDKESAKKDYTEQYAKVKEIMKEYGYGLSDGGYIYLISKEQPKDEGFQVKFKGDRLRVELDGKLKYSGYGPEAIEEFLKGMFYAKKLSSKKIRKSLHKKAISGFHADVMEINERKLDEIRNTAKDMGDEIWARINENIVKIIAYGYDYGKLKILYREPYYDKEEIEEMYENADEVSLADFETLELQREAKISHNLSKKAYHMEQEDLIKETNEEIKELARNFTNGFKNSWMGMNVKGSNFYAFTTIEKEDEDGFTYLDINNGEFSDGYGLDKYFHPYDYWYDIKNDELYKINWNILEKKLEEDAKLYTSSSKAKAFRKLCLKRAFHKTAGEFEEMMKLKSTDPKLIKYLAKEFGVEESTVSQYTDVSENAEELYNILEQQANKYGYEWDKFEYDEYGDRIDEDDFRGDTEELEKAVEYLKNNIDKSMFKFEYVGTYEENYLTFSVNEKLIPIEKPIIHITNYTKNYDISFFAESQQSKEEDKANGIASDDNLTILIRRTSDEILKEIVNYVNVELPKKIEEQNKKQSSKTKALPKKAIRTFDQAIKDDLLKGNKTWEDAGIEIRDSGWSSFSLDKEQTIKMLKLTEDEIAKIDSLQQTAKEKKQIAEEYTKQYYAGKFDLETLHDKLVKVFGDVGTAFEWLRDNDTRIKRSSSTKKKAVLQESENGLGYVLPNGSVVYPGDEEYLKSELKGDKELLEKTKSKIVRLEKEKEEIKKEYPEVDLSKYPDSILFKLDRELKLKEAIELSIETIEDILNAFKNKKMGKQATIKQAEEKAKPILVDVYYYKYLEDIDRYVREKIEDRQYAYIEYPKDEYERKITVDDIKDKLNFLAEHYFTLDRKTKKGDKIVIINHATGEELGEKEYTGEKLAKRQNKLSKSATIKHENGVYNVYSESGKCLGKGYKTKEEAQKRLKQVEYFKNKKANKKDTYEEWGVLCNDLDEEWFDSETGAKIFFNKVKNKVNQVVHKVYDISNEEPEEIQVDVLYDKDRKINKLTMKTSLKQVVISKMAKSLKDIPDSVKRNILSDLVYVILTGKGSFAYKTVAKKLEAIIKELGYGDKLKANEDGSLPTMEIVELISKEPKVMELAGKFANITRAF